MQFGNAVKGAPMKIRINHSNRPHLHVAQQDISPPPNNKMSTVDAHLSPQSRQ